MEGNLQDKASPAVSITVSHGDSLQSPPTGVVQKRSPILPVVSQPTLLTPGVAAAASQRKKVPLEGGYGLAAWGRLLNSNADLAGNGGRVRFPLFFICIAEKYSAPACYHGGVTTAQHT